MSSEIDVDVPPEGAATTAAVRANFAAAKSEIEALQLSASTAADQLNGVAPIPVAIFGDPGSEGSGIYVDGVLYNAVAKTSDIGGDNVALEILHRHSTTWPPYRVTAYSYSDDEFHVTVPAGSMIFTDWHCGWAGSSYKVFGALSYGVKDGVTPNDASAPGKFSLDLTRSGVVWPTPIFYGDEDEIFIDAPLSVPDGGSGSQVITSDEIDSRISAAAGASVFSEFCASMVVRQWYSRTSAADNSWRCIVWSPECGLFVAAALTGTGDRIMTSPDGITWTSRVSAADNNWRGIVWSPECGLFVAVAATGTGDRIMTSPDGITWTSRASAADNNWSSIAWSPECGLFVAVALTGTGDRIMTSPDGITWTSRVSAADNNWRGIVWSPECGLFVAVAVTGTGDRVMTSPDGITWTSRASAADNNWSSIAWSPERGLFVAVATTGTGDRVMTSPDGITWTSRASAADNVWNTIEWSPELGLFVAAAETGTGNRIMSSPDGITWTSRASAADNFWNGIAWSPELGLFAAVGTSGTGNRVMTTPRLFLDT
jgi:hypothetical protein